ncbi:MAG: hypothetical protein DI629_17785 [Mesorhizobium amorphae]|nr:MAG: hypothetical protein DI629_17785 [Mesorhizobium amorphae]
MVAPAIHIVPDRASYVNAASLPKRVDTFQLAGSAINLLSNYKNRLQLRQKSRKRRLIRVAAAFGALPLWRRFPAVDNSAGADISIRKNFEHFRPTSVADPLDSRYEPVS